MGHFLQFSLASHLALSWLWVCIWFNSGSSYVCASLAKMDSSEEAKDSWHHLLWGGAPLFWPFCSCVVRKISLTSRMRNMWSLYLLSRQGSFLSCSCYYLHPGSICPQGTNFSCSALSPPISCLKFTQPEKSISRLEPRYLLLSSLCLTEAPQTVSHKVSSQRNAKWNSKATPLCIFHLG